MLEHLSHMYDEKGTLKNWIPVIGEHVGAYMHLGGNRIAFFGYGRFVGYTMPPIVPDLSEGARFQIAEDLEIIVDPLEEGETWDPSEPKITLESGGEVFGGECFWKPCDEFRGPKGILSRHAVVNMTIGDYRRKLMAEDSHN